MNFAVDGGLCLFMLRLGNMLVYDGWVDMLMNGSIVLSVLGEEVTNSCFRAVHCEICLRL